MGTVVDGVVEQVGEGGLGEEALLHVVVAVHSQSELPVVIIKMKQDDKVK